LELATIRLLEVNDVVASRTIAIWIKPELVSTQTLKTNFAQIFEQFGASDGLHRFAQPRAAVAQILVHVPETETQVLRLAEVNGTYITVFSICITTVCYTTTP
jgi:hypothetical protein